MMYNGYIVSKIWLTRETVLTKFSKYWLGITFFFMQMFVSCFNDIVSKFMGQRLDAVEVSFFRFFFGLVTLLPFVIAQGKSAFKTKQIFLNVVRGILGAVSFFLYIYAVIELPLAEVVIILWTIPLFSLVLSRICLKENVSSVRWLVTIIGFLGLTIVTVWGSNNYSSFNFLYFVPIGASFLFALQDIVIKKMVSAKEDRITMLFYFAFITSLATFPAACKVWMVPTLFELIMLFVLGLGGNLIQYFIFKAFSLIDVSAVAPFRYFELIVSAMLAFIFFSEIPGNNVYVGALILIPCTLYLGYTETKRQKKVKSE